jgi:hypothetical protein
MNAPMGYKASLETYTTPKDAPSGAPTGASHSEKFAYIEAVIGGTNHRGRVIPIADFQVPADRREVYRSIFSFSEDLVTYAATHTSRRGVCPSVEGYPGEALPTRVHVDTDHEDAGVSLGEARRILRHLIEVWEIDAEAITLHYSGNKGFHVEIGAPIFGCFEPSTDAHRRIKRLVLRLLAGLDLTTFDPDNYNKDRLWREPNTINGKSGRYKIPLTADELFTLTIEKISGLATARREIERLPDDEWLPRPELVALWQETARPEEKITIATPPEPRDAADDRAQEVAAIIAAAAWPGAGKRHRAALALVGGLKRAGWSDPDTLAFVKDVVGRAMDVEGTARADEWERAVESTAARVTAGEHVIGWPTLAEILGEAPVRAVRHVLDLVKPPAIAVLDDQVSGGTWKDRALQAEAMLSTTLEVQHLQAEVRRNGCMKNVADTAVALAFEILSAESRGQGDGDAYLIRLGRLAESAGHSYATAKRHVKRLADWGLIKRTYDRGTQVNPETGEIESYSDLYICLPDGPRAFLRALAGFEPPATPDPRSRSQAPRRHCPTCRCASIAQCEPSSDQTTVAPPSDRGARTEEGQCEPSSIGMAKDPPEGFNLCAKCGRLTREEVCNGCADALGHWGVHGPPRAVIRGSR